MTSLIPSSTSKDLVNYMYNRGTNYADILYAFYVFRGDFLAAASAMFEHAVAFDGVVGPPRVERWWFEILLCQV